MNTSNTEDPLECSISLGSRLNHKREQDFNEQNDTITFDVTSAHMDKSWEVDATGIEKLEKVVELSERKSAVGNFTELHFIMRFKRTEYYKQLEAEKLKSEKSGTSSTMYLTSAVLMFTFVIASCLCIF